MLEPTCMHARVSAGVQRPRCAVFVGTEEEATSVGSSLRNSLWGDHAIAVLLPTQGQDPTLVSSNFRRAAGGETFGSMAASRGASVLVAPASVARGLDFANVSYVYTLGVRVTEAAEYAHIAGRTGRVGQAYGVPGHGVVTSVLRDAEEVAHLKAIVEGALGRTLLVGGDLGVREISQLGQASADESPEDFIRRLDDTLLLEVDGNDEDDIRDGGE